MMLAMCVRKTGDTSTPTIQGIPPSGSGGGGAPSTKRKHKAVKGIKTRGKDGEKKAEETQRTSVTAKVRDDGDGHLIYFKGDLIEARCEFFGVWGERASEWLCVCGEIVIVFDALLLESGLWCM